jgi:hypothetical protein
MYVYVCTCGHALSLPAQLPAGILTPMALLDVPEHTHSLTHTHTHTHTHTQLKASYGRSSRPAQLSAGILHVCAASCSYSTARTALLDLPERTTE